MKSGGFGKYVLNTLVTLVAGRAMGVVREELDEAKQEIQEKAKGLAVGVAVLGAAAVLMFFTTGVLLAAAVLGLATGWPAWLSALVIGGGALLIALILLGVGVSAINRNKNLKPERAIRNLRRYFGS